jgi:flagellar biosynthesis protein FlhB
MIMDDHADRTEQPTQRRLEQARRDGRIARSGDLTASVILLAALLALQQNGAALVQALRAFAIATLSGGDAGIEQMSSIAKPAAAVLLAVVVAAIAVNFAQIGIRFRWRPGMTRWSPSRMFHSQSAIPLLSGSVRAIVIVFLVLLAMATRFTQLMSIPQVDFGRAITSAGDILMALVVRVLIACIVLGLLDFAWQRYRLHRDLRMTRREVQAEARETEGDAKLKTRRRQIAAAWMQQRAKKPQPAEVK